MASLPYRPPPCTAYPATLDGAAGLAVARTVGQAHTTPEHTFAELVEAYTRDFLPLKAPRTQYHERLLLRWFAHDLGTIPLHALSPLILRSWLDSLQPFYQDRS
jgi:hypothetical protein